MGVVNPTLPTPGEPRGTEETDVRNALLALLAEFNGNIEASNLAASVRGLFMPVATVAMTARATADDGWLLCDGAAVSRATYAALFTAVGTNFGAGDGLSTFNLPDLRGRAPIGAGTAVGAAGATAHTIGQKDGEENHTLSTAELPAHTHPAAASGGAVLTTSALNVIPRAGTNGTGSDASTGNAGSGAPHNNMPPFQALNFQIKT